MCKKNVLFMIVAMLMMIMVLPNTAYAKSTKKTLQVKVGSLEKNGKKYEVPSNFRKVKMKVTYGGKNVTKKAKYKSSNKKAFTVSKKGVLTVKGAGTSTITVKYAGKTKKVKVQSRTNKSNNSNDSKSHTHKWGDPMLVADRNRATGEYDWHCDECGEQMAVSCKDLVHKGHKGHLIPTYTRVKFYVRQCGCGLEIPAKGYEDIYVPADWDAYDEPYVWDGNPTLPVDYK